MGFVTFIFSSFWIWLGFSILVVAAGNAVVGAAKALRPKRTVKAYRVGQRWHVDIVGANRGDVTHVIKSICEEGEEVQIDEGVIFSGFDKSKD
ncbi:MAG: hypothetical protein VB047_09375 [Anaerotignum propionicum]|uniref:hypothetical protein n=1 Tax=Anaerotignum propionicum TaxID=28446 RepID=UPI002B1EDFB7|nr:hypothetical protein [Anaerotignum propionicum]MEA5057750.1 hypothetical protein [Anaerotignum propionicum]